MKNILLGIVFLTLLTFADVNMTSTRPIHPSLPIVKPSPKPIEKNFNYRPNQYYYYYPYYDNSKERAQQKALAEKKRKIEALEKELNATRKAEQKVLQEKKRAEYEKAMKKFENRKRSISTDNKIIISDEPIK